MSAPSSPTHVKLPSWIAAFTDAARAGVLKVPPSRISSLSNAVWRPPSYPPSPSPIGTHVTFDRASRPSSKFHCLTSRNIQFAQSGGAVVDNRDSCLLIADSREERTDASPLSKAANLFHDCLKLPRRSEPESVAKAIDSACASSNHKFSLEAPGGQAVLFGSVKHGGAHYIFNQGGGMAFLLRKDGGVTCLTDHVLPDHPQFAVDGFVNPGEILFSDIPLRSQPFVTIGHEKCHAARGIGYPSQIPTDPLITLFRGRESGGEYILYVTQEGAQNVQRNEVEAAWKEVQGKNPEQIVGSLTSWFERRSESEEPRMAVVLERLSLIPKPPANLETKKVNYAGSLIPVSDRQRRF